MHTQTVHRMIRSFFLFFFKYRQSFICIPFFIIIIISDYKKKNWVCSRFFQQICFRSGPAWWHEQHFYLHFLFSCCQKGNSVEISRVKREALIWFRMVSTIHTAVATAGIDCTLIYYFFPNNRHIKLISCCLAAVICLFLMFIKKTVHWQNQGIRFWLVCFSSSHVL